MRSIQEMRLECLKLSSALAQGKIISPHEVQQRAEDYYGWLQKQDSARDEPTTRRAEIERIAEKYKR